MSIFNHTISLRIATLADTALVASMHARSWESAYRGMIPDAYLDNEMPAERAAHWQTRMPEIAAGAGCALIAEYAGEPVGFVCVVAPDEDGSVLVDNLHALPGYKGLGVGTVMLAAAARWAREHGARALHLSVLEDNAAAIGFYESRGWKFASRDADTLGGRDLFSLRYTLSLE